MSPTRFVASMLLDGADDQPLKAEMLIRSLVRLGGAAPSEILVHVVPELDETIVAPLRALGCTVNPLAPACGGFERSDLLRQLDALRRAAEDDAGGAWMFSLGTAVTAPLPSPSGSAIVGKVADRERLPLEVVERLFRAAGVRLPPLVPCDGAPGHVVATQLDGGLLYVPSIFADALCDEWQQFTSLVAAQPEIAGEPQRDRLIEELSLALAIAALDLPLSYLSANDSFPLDAETLPASYDPAQPVRALRCDARFDAFGLVSSKVHDTQLNVAIAALNRVSAEPSDTPYFALYKRSAARRARVPALAEDHPFSAASAQWARVFPHRLKFVLHAGTQKTGTTALQAMLHEQLDALAQRGVWYPPARLDPKLKKHQFLIALLTSGDHAGLARAFDEFVRSAPPETRTIVISTEGLHNHWRDFPPESKSMLRHLASLVDLELWTCFRDPMSFAITEYAQFVRNPRQFDPAYGLDIGFDEILENTAFVNRLDYLGFVYEAQDLIGAENVRLFRYGPDIVERFFRALGTTAPGNSEKIVYPSLRRPGVELMRIVNRYDLTPEETYAAAELVLQLDTLIGERGEPLRASPEAVLRVRQLTGRGWRVMEELFEHAVDAPRPLPQDAPVAARKPPAVRLAVPDDLQRNTPTVAAAGHEYTGELLMNLVMQRVGIKDLSGVDILDVGCGVRFAQTIVNRDIAIKSYTGLEVFAPIVDFLNDNLASHDPRFQFHHWNVHNVMYNPGGVELSTLESLPMAQSFDLIWLFSVFTHLNPTDALAMLRLLRKHLRSTGKLFFSAFIDDDLTGFEDRDKENPLLLAYYGRTYMESLIETAGWRIDGSFERDQSNWIQHYFVCSV